MSYDPQKWHYEQMRNRPRHAASKPMLGFGLLVMVVFSVILPLLGRSALESGFFAIGLAIPAIIGMSLSPFGRARLWGSHKELPVDEFEKDALNRASRVSFNIAIILAALTCFWCELGLRMNWPIPASPQHWSQLAWTFLVVGLTLPVFIAELMIPMPSKAEQDEYL